MLATTSCRRFWLEAFSLRGSATARVWPNVMVFGLIAAGECWIDEMVENRFNTRFSLPVVPYELAGAVLGLLLVLRTNTGYDRWWEARKLWGGIVNQSRNLALGIRAYGPPDPERRDELLRWTAAFCHVCKRSLRGERTLTELEPLIGSQVANVALAGHMPGYVMARVTDLLQAARQVGSLDGYAFLQIDRERSTLIDHIGACERILKTPLPRVYSIKIRRFLVIFLLTLPLALLHKLDSVFLIPPIVMLVAYPLLALDQIGIELQNPFAPSNLSSLPLDEICETIAANVLELNRTA